SQSEAIGRLVSLSLRSGIEPDEIVKQLMGISCHMPAWENGNRVLSCSDAISKAIGRYLKNSELGIENGELKTGDSHDPLSRVSRIHNSQFTISVGACPDCGSAMEQADGCLVCRACGYSKCS
ncbi:MAG: TSCPD domain-containing protein, partial [Nitrospinae bacterium]|nr:TSCPD domain-containing protein [Nitrospinota bacterium]